MGVSVHVDTSGLTAWNKAAASKVNMAARRAGSSAISTMRAEGSRAIRERKNMKVAFLKDRLIILPTDKQTMLWRIKAKGEYVPVMAFYPKKTKQGISVEINKGQRKVIRGSFFATMRSTHTGVFLRKGKARLPIKEAYTTTVADAFSDALPPRSNRIVNIGRAKFKEVFERNVRSGVSV